ncbi:MAG: NUDIX hydrolase [Thermoplasmatota archaeon]
MTTPRLGDLGRVVGPDVAGRPDSSVLALFAEPDAEMTLLLERRARSPSRFSGQLCFPGGHLEPTDASALAAALRETQEETGLAPSRIEVQGLLAATTDPRGRSNSCYVATTRPEWLPVVPHSKAEVEELLQVPVTSLLAPRLGPGGQASPALYVASGYEARRLAGSPQVIHYWHLTPPAGFPAATLWGFTAALVALILERGWGWSPPSAPRVVDDWSALVQR